MFKQIAMVYLGILSMSFAIGKENGTIFIFMGFLLLSIGVRATSKLSTENQRRWVFLLTVAMLGGGTMLDGFLILNGRVLLLGSIRALLLGVMLLIYLMAYEKFVQWIPNSAKKNKIIKYHKRMLTAAVVLICAQAFVMNWMEVIIVVAMLKLIVIFLAISLYEELSKIIAIEG